jgi:hypothetical protein
MDAGPSLLAGMRRKQKSHSLPLEDWIMPADKLELVSHRIRSQYLDLAIDGGMRKGGYAYVIELPEISAVLHCRGYRDEIHKLVFRDVARLGHTYCKDVVREVFGESSHVRTTRVDWCVDIFGISVLDLAFHCRLGRVQNCRIDRSRTGITFYPRFSKARTVLLYDKLRQLESKHDPILRKYAMEGPLTRVEVQFKRNLPYRKFDELERYAELDLLSNFSFWQARRKRHGLKIKDSLAAEGLLRRIEENGLQLASKMFSPPEWAYLTKTLLELAPDSKFPDLNKLLQKSARDWLDDRIRFRRLRKKVRR